MLTRMRGTMMAPHPTARAVGRGDGCCHRSLHCHPSGAHTSLGETHSHTVPGLGAVMALPRPWQQRHSSLVMRLTQLIHACQMMPLAAFDIRHTL